MLIVNKGEGKLVNFDNVFKITFTELMEYEEEETIEDKLAIVAYTTGGEDIVLGCYEDCDKSLKVCDEIIKAYLEGEKIYYIQEAN